MKKELFDELLQSVKEAVDIERGKARPSRKFEVKTANDVIRVRNKLGVSQTRFARLLGISEDTLQNWEQGRRKPTGPAKILLKVAAKHSEVALESAAWTMGLCGPLLKRCLTAALEKETKRT